MNANFATNPRSTTAMPPPLRHRPVISNNAILLGRGTVLAKRFIDRRSCWRLDMPGDEALATLLSAAYGRPVTRNERAVVLVKQAAAALLRGRDLAALEALHALPPLPDDAAAERLTKAESLMAGGLPARETLAKVIPTSGVIVVANHSGRGNPYHLPAGTPEGGEFTSAAYAGSGGQPNLDADGKGKNDVRATEPPAPKKATKTPDHTDEDTVYQAVIGFERKRWTPEHQKDDDIAYPPKILRLKDGQTFSGTHPEKNIVQMPVDASLQDSVALGKWIGSLPPPPSAKH